jgi:histidinol-phosphate aminotransferase
MSMRLADESRPSRQLRGDRGAIRFDLSLSENPFPPLPSVVRAVHEVLGEANRYPEFLPRRLPKLIADKVGVHSDQIVVGAGATGVVMQIIQTLTTRGDGIVYGAPTFDGYPIMAAMAELDLFPVPLDRSGNQDLVAMAKAVTRRTKLVVLCRPHNPTGTVIAASELKAFLCTIPRKVTVVLDEAYAEFLGMADQVDIVELVSRHPNLLVLRTFSKAYGLAGLRIGYAVGGRELIGRVCRLQLPFGMGSVAVAAVAASYAAEPELRERILRITTDREILRSALRRRHIDVPRSHANFLFLPGPGIATALRRAGIAAKYYPDGSARVAVGDPDADQAVLAALETFR